MEIIDAHTHLVFPDERRGSGSLWPTFESRLAVLREAGVTRALAGRGGSVVGCCYEELSDRNQRIASACQASQGLLIPSAEVAPHLGERACDLVRHCREQLGMRFIGEMFDRWLGYQWGTPEYYRLLECAVELRVVPLIHCEDAVIGDIGERYPSGKFIIAHLMGAQNRDSAHRFDAMAPYGNLYLDVSGSDIARAGEIKAAVAALGAERVVFGSDMGAVDPVIAVMCVQRAQISEREKQQVFAGTFRAIWDWTEGRS
jgi:predicted TIM-barrel fold metal-dependent hydrolase